MLSTTKSSYSPRLSPQVVHCASRRDCKGAPAFMQSPATISILFRGMHSLIWQDISSMSSPRMHMHSSTVSCVRQCSCSFSARCQPNVSCSRCRAGKVPNLIEERHCNEVQLGQPAARALTLSCSAVFSITSSLMQKLVRQRSLRLGMSAVDMRSSMEDLRRSSTCSWAALKCTPASGAQRLWSRQVCRLRVRSWCATQSSAGQDTSTAVQISVVRLRRRLHSHANC